IGLGRPVVMANDELYAEPEEVLIDVELISENGRHDFFAIEEVECLVGRERVVADEEVFAKENDAVPIPLDAAADRPPDQSVGVAESHAGCRAHETIVVDTQKGHSCRAVEHQGRTDVTTDTSTDARHEIGAELPLSAFGVRRIDADVPFDPQDEPVLEQIIVSEGDTTTEGGVRGRPSRLDWPVDVQVRIGNLAKAAEPQQGGSCG